TSITLNNSGVPIISYRSHGIHHLKVAVCNICAISPQRTTVDDGNGDWVGLHTSLALNNYDVPAISHYNDTDDDLLFTLCYNEPCQGSTTQTVDATGDVGKYNSLALKSNSEPVISYFDDTANDLMIAVCANLGCSAHTLNIVSGILNVDTGKYSSLALNSSDKPIISFYSDLITGLILANCDDTLCSPPAPVTTVDNSANVGWQTSIVLNKDEHAVISYYDVTNFDLKLAICNDAACSNPTIRIVDNGDGVGATSSIALNSNGFPVISYYDSNNTALKVAVCPNATCTTPTLTTVDNTGFVGLYTSIALNKFDHPIISYRDTNNSALKVAFCTDIACTNPALMTVDGAGDLAAGEYSSLALDSSGYPVVSYYDHTNYNLKLAQFDYLPAPTDVSIHLNDSFEANLAWSGGSLYDVRYATVPYIYCGEPSIVGNDIPSPFDVSSFIGDPASNHFFVVSRRHVPCPNSNWVGEFDFALVAGE
ncbi:MAG: hypothetical protein KDE48_23655, partial [Anaerolineales bacterium]|nr:hypothetical protein [Anaerolineales bacterium]